MPDQLTRREVLGAAAAAFACAGASCRGLSPASLRAEPASATIQAIDVHGHFGRCRRDNPTLNELLSGDAAHVVERAREARISWTIVSPLRGLMPRLGADPQAANDEAARIVPVTEGLLQWAIVDPTTPATYDQAARLLEQPWCVGVKIHPEEHGYAITERGPELFAWLAARRAVVLTHSGEANSRPEDIGRLADEHPEVTCILAHLGNSSDGDPGRQVRAIAASRHGNLYVDTSSQQSMLGGLLEWAVGEIGSRRILFGTDTPLYHAPTQRARVDRARISEDDKLHILRTNASRLFAGKLPS